MQNGLRDVSPGTRHGPTVGRRNQRQGCRFRPLPVTPQGAATAQTACRPPACTGLIRGYRRPAALTSHGRLILQDFTAKSGGQLVFVNLHQLLAVPQGGEKCPAPTFEKQTHSRNTFCCSGDIKSIRVTFIGALHSWSIARMLSPKS